MNFIVVIPARYSSKRFPGKPLADISGIPMVIRTYLQCIKAVSPDLVYVATDDDRIKNICDQWNIKVIITSKDCLTGTDRIAEVASIISTDFYINIQGDEPIFNPDDISLIIKAAYQFPGAVINGYSEIINEADYFNYGIPKVVFDEDCNLLYMSRAPIPANKDSKFVRSWRQICAYSYPQQALKLFNEAKQKKPLELMEDIEMLRFLELGVNIKMVKMSNQSISVDKPADIQSVESIIQNFKELK